MLRVVDLTLARGTKRLLEGANLTLHAGHKVGLIGANGSGKTSLFAAIRNELLPAAGSMEVPAAWSLAYVALETPAVATPAIDYVLDGDRELREIERALAAAAADHKAAHADDAITHGAALADLHHRFEAIDGYSARARAATLLAGLGFAEPQHRDPVASFSGGWR
ncbi:MAG TPA: ATP-binding cassette domain-containing protein, partial [Casimicrobiaceae bacterium]|nr:ATP-binding cassette domain-containing protein [Casimicrobiaceae bacterium]